MQDQKSAAVGSVERFRTRGIHLN